MDSGDFDQSEWMQRLIRVIARRKHHIVVSYDAAHLSVKIEQKRKMLQMIMLNDFLSKKNKKFKVIDFEVVLSASVSFYGHPKNL